MSEGLAKFAAAPTTLTLGGRDYTVRPLRFSDFAAIERHLLARRTNLIEKLAPALGSLTAEAQERVIKAAITQMDSRPNVTAEETSRFMGCFEGIAYTFWLLMHDAHPELETPAQVASLIGELDINYLSDLLDRASGLSDLKKSSGREGAEALPAGMPATNLLPASLLSTTPDVHESRGRSSITG